MKDTISIEIAGKPTKVNTADFLRSELILDVIRDPGYDSGKRDLRAWILFVRNLYIQEGTRHKAAVPRDPRPRL